MIGFQPATDADETQPVDIFNLAIPVEAEEEIPATQPEGDEGHEDEDEEEDEEDEVKKPREVQPRGDDMLSRLQNTQKKLWSGNFS